MSFWDEVMRQTNNNTQSSLDPSGVWLNRDRGGIRRRDVPNDTQPEMPDEEATRAAYRRRLAAYRTRGGRQSTILAAEERLGG